MTVTSAQLPAFAVDVEDDAELTFDAFMAYLFQRGHIDRNGIDRIARAQDQTSASGCQLLSKLGLLDERNLSESLSDFLGISRWDKDDLPNEPLFEGRINEGFLKEELLLPIKISDGCLHVATCDPFSAENNRALHLATDLPVAFIPAAAGDIATGLKSLYDTDKRPGTEPNDLGNDAVRDDDLQRLKDMATEAPVIRFVNDLFSQAIEARASDIHLEPFHHTFRVRLRVDGLLREMQGPSPNLGPAILSRVKLLAKLNIAERRLPQDGRLHTTVRGRALDIRVSTVPTLYGESVVLRLLDKSNVSFDFPTLGFSDADLARYLHILREPNGIILVTGPTGSGKTTTLYASLLHLNTIDTKILTVEDPIEYELTGINQIQVKPQIGLSFANALRALVRQDPDVILIGEIRDGETAEIACQSALTGHRVLSTLHTNDAVSAIPRLIDLGVADFLIGATVRGIVAQRLVRRLCETCKTEAPLSATSGDRAWRAQFQTAVCLIGDHGTYFEPVGCKQCQGTGFKGRFGIYEIVALTDTIRDMIKVRASASALFQEAQTGGTTSMMSDGMAKAAAGLTTVEEVLRATREP